MKFVAFQGLLRQMGEDPETFGKGEPESQDIIEKMKRIEKAWEAKFCNVSFVLQEK